MTKPTRRKRSLAEGPAVRRALAQTESESKAGGSWKLLESPELSEVSEVSDLLKALDEPQPEPSWKIPKPMSQLAGPPPRVRQPSASRAVPPPVGRRTTVATQIGVAPPPPPVDLASTHLGMPPPPPIAPARARQRDARSPSPADVAGREQVALAATQVAAPRPAELDPLLSPPSDPLRPVHRAAETLPAAEAVVQPPTTARPPEVFALARTQAASSPAASSIAGDVPRQQMSPEMDESTERAPISSEAFATTHDTLPPLPTRPAFELGPLASLRRIPHRKLIGIGSLALIVAALPLVLLSALREGQDPSAQTRAKGALEVPKKALPITQAKPQQVDKERAGVGVASASVATKPRQPNENVASAGTPLLPEANTAGAADVPWDDLPPVKTASCDSLATHPQGPPGFILQNAVKNGQRELIRGNVKAAHVAFCEATLLGQPSDTVLIGLSQVLLMQSDVEGALKAVDTLLERRPRDRQALQLRGDMLVRMGRVDEALADWYRAAGATRASASLTSNLIRASRMGASDAQRAGDLSRADRMWRRVIALDSTDIDACAALASVLLKKGEQVAAKRWLTYAESLDPEHASVQAVKNTLSG